MTQDTTWGEELTRRIGANVRSFRGKLGISAQKLSDRTRDIGYEIPRNTIANLENGRKSAIALQELLVLSKALDVPAASLIASPYDPTGPVRLTPDVTYTSVYAYLNLAPDMTIATPTDEQNTIALAQQRVQEYQHLLAELQSVHLRREKDLQNSLRTGKRTTEYEDEFYKTYVSQLRKKLDKAAKKLEDEGIEPWTLEESDPPHES